MINKSINIMLVSHTNAGKTTLIRTLLGQDVGEVLDAPDVTHSVSSYDLASIKDHGALCLWDTPGFGDSFRLAKRLAMTSSWTRWFVRECWDRYINPRLWRSQRVAIDIKQRADVIVYLVNSLERPVDAVYVQPELSVLGWIDKPVLVILNQSGGRQHPECVNDSLREWQDTLSLYPIVHSTIDLDSFTRCWVQELALYDEIGNMLDGVHRASYNKLAQAVKSEHHKRLQASVEILAIYLSNIATDNVELTTGWFEKLKDLWGSMRKRIPWSHSEELEPHELAMKTLAQRYMDSTKLVTERLIEINRLTGATTGEIVETASKKFSITAPLDAATTGLTVGVISGFATGLGADLIAGGLTLGTGALVGAALGLVGSAALAKGYNLYTSKGEKVIGWSETSFSEALENALLLYLAIAHFGRGQGDWYRKVDSEYWKNAVNNALNDNSDQIKQLWKHVREESHACDTQSELTVLLKRLLTELLEIRYPGKIEL
jgi:GTPase SAR1 family protein